MLAASLCVLLLITGVSTRLFFHDGNLLQGDGSLMKRSRLCLINAGLSQGCDLSDIIFARQQARKFSSFAGPGRR